MSSGQRIFQVAASLVALLIVVLTFARITFVKAYYDQVALWWSFAYDGRHIDYYGDRLDADALQWIRRETPADSIVLLQPGVHKYSHLIHERRTYARGSQASYTAGFPQYQLRLDRMKAVYSVETLADEYRRIIIEMTAEIPGELFYAVVSDAEIGFETMTERGARRVFTHPASGGHVYLLNP